MVPNWLRTALVGRTRFQTLLFLHVAACLAAAQTNTNEGAIATFRSAISNVKIDVQVTNNSQLVRDLTLTDFVLFDEKRQRDLLFVDRGAEPLSLALLLDVSGSMRTHVEAVASVAMESLRFLRAGDTVAVIVFGKRTKTRLQPTADHTRVESEITAGLNDQDVGTETAINDAIANASEMLVAGTKQQHQLIGVADRNCRFDH